MRIYYVSCIAYFFLSFSLHVYGGFVGNTSVLTHQGLVPMHAIEPGASVVSFDGSGVTERCITHKQVKQSLRLIALYIEKSTVPLICALTQKIYVANAYGWKNANAINTGDQLLSADGAVINVIAVSLIDASVTDVYEITIDVDHTYFVSEQGILVHNPLPAVVIGISFAFGGGAIEFAGITLSIGLFGMWIIGKCLNQKHAPEGNIGDKGNCTLDVEVRGAFDMPAGKSICPSDDTLPERAIEPFENTAIDMLEKNINMAKKEEKKKPKEEKDKEKVPQKEEKKEKRNSLGNNHNPQKDERDTKRANHQVPTEKEGAQQAEKMGFNPVKVPPFDGVKGKVYEKDGKFISIDQDGHKGGYWKQFNRKGKRIFTWDKDMKVVIGS